MKKLLLFSIPTTILLFLAWFLISVTPTSNRLYDNYVRFVAMVKAPQLCQMFPFGRFWGDYFTSPEQSRYSCFADYAIETGDIEYCKQLDPEERFLGSATQKNYCLRGLAKKLRRPDLCDDLKMKEPFKKYELTLIETCKGEFQ